MLFVSEQVNLTHMQPGEEERMPRYLVERTCPRLWRSQLPSRAPPRESLPA